MRIPVVGSPSTLGTDRNPVRAVATQRSERRCRVGRAYRAGRLVCGCVHVTVGVDDRLGLTARERRLVLVRVHEPVDDALRRELALLVRRRGMAARRVADALETIELIVDGPGGERQRIVGRLQPPQVRHGQLRDIEFGLRELEATA